MDTEELLARYQIIKAYTEGQRYFVGISLDEANLSRVNLSQCDLSQASLCVVNLSGAILNEVNLTGAKLNVARMSSTSLVKAILNQAVMNVANLVRADLTDAELIETSLIRAEMIRAELSQANFTGANLTQADLRDSKVNSTNFTDANLSSTNLKGLSGNRVNFQYANLHGADLTQAYLKEANLRNADLRQAILSQINLSGADLSRANLRWADLSGANLSGADLSEAKLTGAIFYGANLSQANLGSASLVHADLSHANLLGVDWFGADLSGATLTGAKLYQVSRFGLKAEEVNCEWIDISPKGDHSQTYRFTSAQEANKFFNHRPPVISIVIDAAIDYQSYHLLSQVYYEISQKYPLLTSPPSIEVGYRQTLLTFCLEKDEYLFSSAFMVILPFLDAVSTQKNLITLVKSLQSYPQLDKKRIISLSVLMNEAINKLNEIKKTVPAFTEKQLKSDFFKSPSQTVLSNSSEEILTIYCHSHFGKHLTHTEPTPFVFPPMSEIIAFLETFYYFS